MIYQLIKILLLVSVLAGCSRNTYVMVPRPGNDNSSSLPQMPDSLLQKLSEGIEYYAAGREPVSWELNMNPERQFSFLSEGNNLTLIAKAGIKTNTGTNYFLTDAAGAMRINILDINCADSKSQQTIVTVNNKVYKGCGQFLYDRNLEGKWQLAKIMNKAIERSDYPKQIPEIVFNTLNKSLSVHTSCNKVALDYTIYGHKLSVPLPAISTARCNTKFDEILFESFYGKICTYYIKGNNLSVYLIDDSIIEFTRI